MRGGGAENQSADQVRLFNRNAHGDHTALGRAEQADPVKAQRPDCRCRIPRDIPVGIHRGQFLPPVEHINRKPIFEGSVCRRHGIREFHDAFHAESGQDHERLIPVAEAEIIHREIICRHRFNPDLSGHLLLLLRPGSRTDNTHKHDSKDKRMIRLLMRQGASSLCDTRKHTHRTAPPRTRYRPDTRWKKTV